MKELLIIHLYIIIIKTNMFTFNIQLLMFLKNPNNILFIMCLKKSKQYIKYLIYFVFFETKQ